MSDGLAIDVHGLTKRFGERVAVRDLSLAVRRGAIHGFLGPNGSGKTTTLRMLTGLLRPDAGHGTCLGHDILRESGAIKRKVGYMTQRFALYADLTARENLDFVARVHGLPRPRRRVDEALERLGLASRADQLAGNLSGGWKQRLALGACLLPGPELLLLDEPTAGVDPQARREFWDEIHELARGGMTALVSTHYMDEAERCHELAFVSRGELLASGPVEALLASSRLVTFTITGPDLHALSARLSAEDGVEGVAPFGNALHVAGRDRAKLEAALAGFAGGPHRVVESAPTLEDLFIDLVRRHAREPVRAP